MNDRQAGWSGMQQALGGGWASGSGKVIYTLVSLHSTNKHTKYHLGEYFGFEGCNANE
jgi:hypothetical protein